MPSRQQDPVAGPLGGLRTAGEIAAWWVVMCLLYTVFISTVSPLELAVGAGASGLAAVGGWAVRRAARPRSGPARHLAAALWTWPWTLLTETFQLARVTAVTLRGRPVSGRFVSVRLRPGVGVAWACALLSGTPGSCVVGVEKAAPGRSAVLRVHAVFPGRSALQRVLGDEDDA